MDGVCPDCNYAETAGKCMNPVCARVNPAAAAKWQAVAEVEAAERAERERIAAIRERAWSWRSGD